jgi:hypothetical protein
VRDGRGVVDLHPLLVGYLYALVADHAQLFKSQRVFRIVDVPDQLEYLKLVEGVVNLVVVLLLATSFEQLVRYL